jgi:nucleoside-diphosphate kinase
VNETGTLVSERVHLSEIVVIPRSIACWGCQGISADRLPFADGADISAAIPPSALCKDEIMAIERTFSIIKPDATARNLTGAINALIEKAGLRIVAQKRVRMTREQAETFYAVHKERPFFRELVDFMISGPVVVQVLEGENAVLKNREVMGATDPSKAADGTIRKLHAKSIGENSVHGSDAPETAAVEIAQFFSGNEIVG